MKRLSSILFAAALSLCLFPTALAAETDAGFSDVSPDD